MAREMGPTVALIYMYILEHPDAKNREIAQAVGVSVSTVQRALRRLEELGRAYRVQKGKEGRLLRACGAKERRVALTRKERESLLGRFGERNLDMALLVLEHSYSLSQLPPRRPAKIAFSVLSRGSLSPAEGFRPVDDLPREVVEAFWELTPRERGGLLAWAEAKLRGAFGEREALAGKYRLALVALMRKRFPQLEARVAAGVG